MRTLGVVCAVLLWPVVASAQAPTSYQGNYYNVGAAQPLQQTDNFPASAALCNQTAPTGGSTVNPTTFVWNDIANVGKVCLYTVPAAGALLSLPTPGNYEATLTAINAVGRAESTRVPFSRLGAPAAPTGLKMLP